MNDSTIMKCVVVGCLCEVNASNIEDAILKLQKHTKEKHPQEAQKLVWQRMQGESRQSIG